ncbi:MAG: hypothetical protein IJH78_06770 [Clostridia bacterium]|nr:hypothetical protein [Clostridia bacterium]
MKKIFALILVAMMLFAAGAMAEENAMTGGWTPSADPAITEDVQALFDKGLEGLVGVDYVPVAYLGSQVVAGTNHAILCQGTVVYPDAAPAYFIIYLYEDLEGNVSIMNIADLDIGSLCTYGAEETAE